MKIIVASKNPVKLDSTKEAFQNLFPDQQCEVTGVDVPSGVSDQPMSDEETLQGAINRSENAQKSQPTADLWVGIEGGTHETQFGMEAFAWVVVKSKTLQGQAKTSTFYLPPEVTKLIHDGVELGHANDQVFKERNSKQKGGAIGSLTHGVLGRTEYYVQAVMLALIPFRNSDLYQTSN